MTHDDNATACEDDRHVWSPGCASGDTCNCGGWYGFTYPDGRIVILQAADDDDDDDGKGAGDV